MTFGLILAMAVNAGGVVASPAEGDDRRPYEIVRANRRADEVPPALPLVSADGWRTVCSNAEAKVATATDRLLFGDGVLRVDYRATGKDPEVRILLAEPVALPAFDTFSYWLYGNNFYGSHAKRKIPMADVYPLFADADGNPFELGCVWVHHQEWCKFQKKVSSDLLPRTTRPGCRFLGWRIAKGTNVDFLRLDFTSVCAWTEELKPLHYKPRAKRGVRIFPDQDQGVNVGEGRLPFPTAETTVVPQVAAEDKSIEFRFPAKDGVWDDLAFRIDGGAWIPLATGGGVWPRSAADLAQAKFSRIGDSVVADIAVKGGAVSEVRFGETELPGDVRRDPIPFLPYGAYVWDDRPCVLSARVGGTDVFVSAISDWTQGNSSEPYPPARIGTRGRAANGGVRYLPKTDGTRNDVFERFVWTVSRRFEATLPEIPNPVSPWKSVTGTHAWTRSIVEGDRTTNRDYYRDLLRRGITKLICTDHETMWRDGDESFTFRTNAAPQRGGNAAQLDYTRWMIETNGLYYGPYNNFTDLSPVNEHWHSDRVMRDSSGNFRESWARCYSPKPLYGVEMCEKLTPVLKRMYGFNTAYCDVHTACKPWQRTDYDFRVPGAGTYAQTFYAYGEILLLQREMWGGPVCSEGGSQCYYVGLVDQNYAQDSIYGFMEHPWILDFVLLRMHPKCCDHGPFLGMLFGGTGVPKDTWRAVDAYLAYQLAYGYSPLVLKEQKSYSYFMNLAIAALYTQADVKSIRYVGADGSLLTTSAAVRNGAIARNQSVVEYGDGTKVVVNGSTADERLAIRWEGGRLDLPPMGVYAEGGETVVFAGEQGGCRVSFCRAPDYVYLCGRGSGVRCPGGATDGEVVRLKSADGSEEVIPQTELESWSFIELPYRAVSVTGLSKEGRQPTGPVPFTVTERGWTRICRGDTEAYSFRVTPPKDFAEAPVAAYRAAVVVPATAPAAADALRVVAGDLAAVTGAAELEVLFDGRRIGTSDISRKDGVVTRTARWTDWAFRSRFTPAGSGRPAMLEVEVENACIRTDTIEVSFTARGTVTASFPGDRIVLHDLRENEKRTVTFVLGGDGQEAK